MSFVIKHLLLVCAVWSGSLCARAQAPVQPASAESAAMDAQDPPGYPALVQAALEEYRQRHFEEARSLLIKAHALFPNARTLRVLGMAEFELRNYGMSTKYLEECLASTVRPLDEAMRRDVEGLLARAKGFTVLLKVYVEPATATVRLDGEPTEVGLDAPFRVTAGDHQLEAEAPGYERQIRRLELVGGDEQLLRLNLTKTSDSVRPLRRNPWLWTGISAVVVGAALGTFFALQSRDPGSTPADGGSAGAVLLGPHNGEGR
jgi:hypothetical protein